MGFAAVFAAVSGGGVPVVSCDDAQAKVPAKPTAEGDELMNQEILQTGGLMFYGRDLAQRWIFVRVGGVRRVVVREVSSLRCRMAMTLGLCAIAVSLAGCGAGGKLPDKSSKEYTETVSAFYTGLAALQVGDDVTAESKLVQVTQLAPGEPAGWANWGVLAFRQRNFDAAAQRYERARDLAPKNDQIYYLLGILQSTRGNSKEAIADWRKAVAINPQNYRAAYQLAQEVEREGGPGSDAEFESLMQNILKAQPDNLAAWLELARAAAKRGDAATLQSALGQIRSRATQWPPEVQAQLAALTAAAAAPDARGAATRTTFLRNTLMRVAEFRESLAVLQAAPGEEAEPFTHFLRLEPPAFVPAPADTALTFTPQALSNPGANSGANAGAKRWEWIGAVPLGSAGPPVVAEANGREVRLSTGATFPFPGGTAGVAPLPEGILPIDFNYDFNNDLVLAGAGGVRLMRQDNPKLFTDVTAQAKLPQAVTRASYTGAWAVDIEADGDLDIVLGAKEGLPLVLRNNGDGTFTAIHPFPAVTGLRAFAWADFDGDGNPDAALVDGAGHLHVFHNERQAQFRELPLPAHFPLVKALNVADVDDDGVLDLLAVQVDGAIVRVSDKEEGKVLDVAEIARVPDYLSGEVRLRVADLDNNGALDLFLTGASLDTRRNAFGALIWLADEKGKFVLLEHPFGQAAAPALISDAADLSGNGRLDLLALTAEGGTLQAVNHGSNN